MCCLGAIKEKPLNPVRNTELGFFSKKVMRLICHWSNSDQTPFFTPPMTLTAFKPMTQQPLAESAIHWATAANFEKESESHDFGGEISKAHTTSN